MLNTILDLFLLAGKYYVQLVLNTGNNFPCRKFGQVNIKKICSVFQLIRKLNVKHIVQRE